MKRSASLCSFDSAPKEGREWQLNDHVKIFESKKLQVAAEGVFTCKIKVTSLSYAKRLSDIDRVAIIIVGEGPLFWAKTDQCKRKLPKFICVKSDERQNHSIFCNQTEAHYAVANFL